MKGRLSLNKQQRKLGRHPAPRCEEQLSTGAGLCVGLANLGNTCYCNAVLQALRHCPGFSLALKKTRESVCSEYSTAQVLTKLLEELDQDSATAVAPSAFLESLRLSGKFRAGVQHDAQELLNHLLTDTLANCPRVRFVSLSDQMASVTALFEGKLAFQTQCFDCDHLTRRTEPFIHVTVPVTCQGLPGFPPPAQNQCYTNSAASAVSISWCLSRLLSRERLTEENKFWCENCQHLVEAERSTLFASLPNVLTLHLNRFSVQEWGRSVHKVSGSVAVPMSLCLKLWSTRDCVASDSVYLLQAIVLHTGVSCNSGHYTAIVRQGRQWLHCDDETVTVMSEAAVLELLLPFPLSSATPYILFYCNSLL